MGLVFSNSNGSLGRFKATTVVLSSDPDVQAFLSATGITDGTIISATNTLVTDLKGYGIWTKMKAIYPFVGGTSTTHKFNLKDPRDLDAAFRLVFSGGWTHSANGIQGNGTNAFASTKLNPFIDLTNNNTHLSFYSRTSAVLNNARDVAAFEGGSNPAVALGTNTGVWISDQNDFNIRISASIASATGFYIGTRVSNILHKLFKNGSILATNNGTNALNLPNTIVFIGAANISTGTGESATAYSSKQCAFASIGDGLTDTEASNFYTAVQAFQTTLGRQV